MAPEPMRWQAVTAAHLRAFLALPELALVPESCTAERALHESLQADPARAVTPAQLERLRDADARANYALFLRFRDGLLQAGSVEACYLGLVRSGQASLPPVFLDLLVEMALRPLFPGALQDASAAMQARAADLLHRPQRISTEDGHVLAGDQATLDMLHSSAGLGEIGRLLVQGGAPMPTVQMEVLTGSNAPRYLDQLNAARGIASGPAGTPGPYPSASHGRAHRWLLDLGFDQAQHVGYALAHPRPGLRALADVLEAWVAHFLGTAVRITPLQKIEDAAWRWHTGLDAESSAVLNDLYTGQEVGPERLQRLVSLFRLEFADPADMRADVAGKPVYLGLARRADGICRLKPQNLLLNLPLAPQAA